MCNGHADTCDNTDPRDAYKLVCRCQHNTCGDQCQTCCRGYQQKAWKQSKANALFVCERKSRTRVTGPNAINQNFKFSVFISSLPANSSVCL